MHDLETLERFLSGATIAPAVAALRPDYRVMLVALAGIVPSSSNDSSEALLRQAEAFARDATAASPVEELPHIAAWRDAYRAFGAKPQRTRNSLEALTRRADAGLPRVNRLTDIYNAISVLHQIPLGGEDLDRYAGPPRLVRSDGSEPFDTTADGTTILEHPEVGEVVWCDDAGVTCRRWNWRQATRTQLRDDTTAALFILDVLSPITDAMVTEATDELVGHLSKLGPDVRAARRLLRADTSLL